MLKPQFHDSSNFYDYQKILVDTRPPKNVWRKFVLAFEQTWFSAWRIPRTHVNNWFQKYLLHFEIKGALDYIHIQSSGPFIYERRKYFFKVVSPSASGAQLLVFDITNQFIDNDFFAT